MSEQKYEFDWNDAVVVVDHAPAQFRASKTAAVVGMRTIENQVDASASGFPLETVLYTVEFSDGIMIEIPASFLRMG